MSRLIATLTGVPTGSLRSAPRRQPPRRREPVLQKRRVRRSRLVAAKPGPTIVSNTRSTSRIDGDGYYVSEEDARLFHEQGYVHLPCVLTAAELAEHIEPVYRAFLAGDIPVPGRDLCDMGGGAAAGTPPARFSVFNVMLPRRYFPAWQGNLFERRTQAIAEQLLGGGEAAGGPLAIDYDQILAKRPGPPDGEFPWHQDAAYWPPFTASQETATCWLALDPAGPDNGGMRFVPGSHREAALRPHAPLARGGREGSHALVAAVDGAAEAVHYAALAAGDVTVHGERVLHGSGPNTSRRWRRAYVVAYRREACIAEERAAGFTHSHNDTFSWDAWNAQHQSSASG
eukprot:jgi/Tetstr1/461630/TSEL_006730.t1